MSTYIEMLRAHRAKQKAASESPGERRSDGPVEEPLLPDDVGTPEPPPSSNPGNPTNPLDEEVSDLARTALRQVGDESSATTRDAPNYIDMMRTHQGRTGFPAPDKEPAVVFPSEMPETPSPSDTSEAPTLGEEPFPQTPAAMMQDERPGEGGGDTGTPADSLEAALADETADLPHPPLDLTESNGATSQAAWLSGCVALLLRIYEDASHNVPSDLAPLLTHLEKFTDAVYEDIERLNALELEISNHIDEFRNQHLTCGDLLEKAVMMMLYGIKVCMQLHMEPPEITRHVAAAMLHNVGMALILVDTRLKESTLSDVERALIRRTPEKSLEYLKDCGVTDPLLLQAAEQSQERFDGSGPQGLAGTDIALSARITSLLSMFEALVHFRAYRERLLPRDAIRELVNRYKSQFDPEILKVLIESVSLYPVGTYVQLNSGDVGQVIRIQPRLPMRPRVLLTLDRHGNKIQPREVDLREQPNLMVQRCMYAAGLASLKQAEEKA